jgi:hypothetical protein
MADQQEISPPAAPRIQIVSAPTTSTSFWRENFGALATIMGVIIGAVATLITIDSTANQPPATKISILQEVQGQPAVRAQNGQLVVPVGEPLIFSADQSDDDGAFSKLQFFWQLTKLPCQVYVTDKEKTFCKAEAVYQGPSWSQQISVPGLYAVTLTATDDMDCHWYQSVFFSACSRTKSSSVFLDARTHNSPMIQLLPTPKNIQADQPFEIARVLSFDDAPVTYQWSVDGLPVSQKDQYTLRVDARAREAQTYTIEVVVRDSWGKLSEIVRRNVVVNRQQEQAVAEGPTPNPSSSVANANGSKPQDQASSIKIQGEMVIPENGLATRFTQIEAIRGILRALPSTLPDMGSPGALGTVGTSGLSPGEAGKPGGPGGAGGRGKDGTSAKKLVLIGDTLDGQLVVDASGQIGGAGGIGGLGGLGGAGAQGKGSVSGTFDCRSGPGHGGNGGSGGDGGQGGFGGNGGDAGEVEVILGKMTPGSSLEILAAGGVGGIPGPGGKGGPGGPPGAEGETSGWCQRAGRGGLPGPPGLDGSSGRSGGLGHSANIALTVGQKRITGAGRVYYTEQ